MSSIRAPREWARGPDQGATTMAAKKTTTKKRTTKKTTSKPKAAAKPRHGATAVPERCPTSMATLLRIACVLVVLGPLVRAETEVRVATYKVPQGRRERRPAREDPSR